MLEYNKASLIKFYRRQRGMTQEELSENICEPYTLARYENGTLNPSDKNYHKIMEKLSVSDETIFWGLQTEEIKTLEVKDRLLDLFEERKYEQINDIIKNLLNEDIVPMTYTENKQFIYRIKLAIDYESEKMDLREYIYSLEKLLRLSFFTYNSEKFESKFIYTENEMALLNDIAIAYAEANNYDIAYNIFSKTIKHIEKNMFEFNKFYYYLLLNFSNLLGIHNFHKESINICKKGISWLLKANTSNYIYNFIYNIGWNYIERSKKSKKNQVNKYKKIGLFFIWEAYQLCELYPENKDNLSRIKEYFYKNQ